MDEQAEVEAKKKLLGRTGIAGATQSSRSLKPTLGKSHLFGFGTKQELN